MLFFIIGTSCGVVYNYTESLLFLNGFVKCYDQPYSSSTTSRDLDACYGSQLVFVGAKKSSSSIMFEIGAFGSPKVLNSSTNSTITAYYDDLGGAYWYLLPSYSFGFASSSSIALRFRQCDLGGLLLNNDCAHRLCWTLEGYGGVRAGCVAYLHNDQTWRKVIYKGNSVPACFPGMKYLIIVIQVFL